MSGMGLSSVSAVAEHIDNLVALGALKKIPGAARSLEIIDHTHPETVLLFQHKLTTASEEETEILHQLTNNSPFSPLPAPDNQHPTFCLYNCN